MKKISSTHEAGDIKTIDLGDGIVLEMVFVPAGEFMMGSPETEKDRNINEAQHRVIITKPFFICKYPVTQEQWLKIMGYNYSRNRKGGKYPAENMDCDECLKFISRLKKMKLVDGRFRLPTEAEWEYAYRAGTTTAYYWGNEMNDEYCWYRKINNVKLMRAYYSGSTHKVGMKKPNAWGLYDMAGNVFELCSD
ncbi:MAG TPA: formylglycine-generating enzyme family protein [Candidatus Wallbacteria bacterium]|nr:formylglycine-generating enzyme family protein [Candidatus Wallbacteria bacterium]